MTIAPQALDLLALDVRSTPDTRLEPTELQAHLSRLNAWSLEGQTLVKTLRFPDFHHTMAFVNAVAWVAHQGDHHPDLKVGYAHCEVRWSTHSAGGLTLKDLICAAQVDALRA